MNTAESNSNSGPTRTQLALKRAFDFLGASIGLILVGWIIVLAALVSRRDTGGSGIFRQLRIGRHGRMFRICKIRTMRDVHSLTTNVTTARDYRITPLGALLRRWKIDELPQLYNVLRGDMSFVGPRPEVREYLEQIREHAPAILSVRPGITGPASLKYRNEEQLLAAQHDPQAYNDLVVFPDKLRINAAYIANYQVATDLKILWKTIFKVGHGESSNQNANIAEKYGGAGRSQAVR